MNILKKLFRTASAGSSDETATTPQPLAIEGIPEAPFTAEPDDAELAAQAVLEMMCNRVNLSNRNTQGNQSTQSNQNTQNNQSTLKSSAYYRDLADRIREAHRIEALRATRFVTACEYNLKDGHLSFYGPGSLQLLETELYKRLDVIEREGGELKRRWQHCLATVTLRLMEHTEQEEKEKHDGNTPCP